ncbi:hypothetical protein [Microbacterium testaceum]|uniref:hypothetical protein n=1 Tax=Microbacterium testaceum TaxID=2033 RepID=UPI002AC5F830|nr:hypothetical protein [Microbacterium testaceum]MDZ5144866.1 DUF2599 domain-containing protein [Microbacterium testaceum]
MISKHWTCRAATATITMMLALLPTAANADDGDPPPTLDTLQSVTSTAAETGIAAQEILNDVADASTVETAIDGSLSMDSGDTTTVIPATSDEPIKIGDVEIEMPSPGGPIEGERVADAVVSFESDNGFTTVPVLKDDGSVQITTIMSDKSAPSSYAYHLTLPATARLTLDASGFVSATIGDELALGVAPAWAVDAEGRAVPTHYEIDGSTLRQVVDHSSSSFAYPIVADPWAGQRLFDSVWISGYTRGIANVSLVTSPWGRMIQAGVQGWGQGQLILNGAGWAEAVSKAKVLGGRSTYYQQYQCHVLGAYTPASGGPSWDLEGYRANRLNWRIDGGAFPYKCNWP